MEGFKIKGKKLIYILSITFLLVIVFYFLYQNYSLGSRDEREEILTAVIFNLTENQEVSEEEIDKIYVLRSYAGVYPYYYSVAVEFKNGKRIKYGWADKEKSHVEITTPEGY